jgi:hypothetical protein
LELRLETVNRLSVEFDEVIDQNVISNLLQLIPFYKGQIGNRDLEIGRQEKGLPTHKIRTYLSVFKRITHLNQ